MKRSVLLIILAAMLLSGCGIGGNGTFNMDDAGEAYTGAEKTKVGFGDWYVRTDGGAPGKEYPVVTVIRSEDEMIRYYINNRDIYDLGDDETYSPYAFIRVMSSYDDQFFERCVLVLVLVSEPSSSISHNVRSVISQGGKAEITVERILPQTQESEEAQWHIFIQFDKEYAANGVKTNIVDMDSSKITEIPFTAHYIRSYGSKSHKDYYPPSVVIRSVSELKEHFNGEIAEWNSEGFFTDEPLGMYDDKFFEDKVLIITWGVEDWGSTRYNVALVTADSIGITLYVERLDPNGRNGAGIAWSTAVAIDKQYVTGDVRVEIADDGMARPLKGDDVWFAARYALTPGGGGKEFPSATVIHSLSQLEDYYGSNKDVFDLDTREQPWPYFDFPDEMRSYDEEFFESGHLILALVKEPVAAIHHNVMSVTVDDDGNAVVYAERPAPEMMGGEMQPAHIFINVFGEIKDARVELIDEGPLFSQSIPYKTHYIPTERDLPYWESHDYKLINSAAELQECYDSCVEQYDFEDSASEWFGRARNRYDDAYFKDNALILIQSWEGGISSCYMVRNVTASEKGVSVILQDVTLRRKSINALLPDAPQKQPGEDGWYIVVEAEKAYTAGGVRVGIL